MGNGREVQIEGGSGGSKKLFGCGSRLGSQHFVDGWKG